MHLTDYYMHCTGWRLCYSIELIIYIVLSLTAAPVRLQSPSLGVLAMSSMSWLKRFRGKRPKSNHSSPDEVSASSSQPTLTPTVLVDLKGKKRARNTIAVGGKQVFGSTVPYECTLNMLSGHGPWPNIGICRSQPYAQRAQ
jgi:hypothetical protein